MFTTRFQAWFRGLALRAAAPLGKLPVTPNQLTLFGLLVTTGAGVLVALNHPFLGGLALLFAGVFDVFDGALARATSRSYAYGAFLDSTADRYSEGVVMVALLIYFQRNGQALGPVLVVAAMAGSFLVSYVRARAQSLGFKSEGGLLARPERVLLTVAGLVLTPFVPGALLAIVALLAVFTNLTVAQRVYGVWRQARPTANTPPPAVRGEVRVGGPAASARSKEDREVRPGPEPAGG